MTRTQQRGFANSTMLFMLMVAIMGFWLLFHLIPFYMENQAVSNVLDELTANAEIQQKSNEDIKRIFLESLAAKEQKRITPDNFDKYVTIVKPVEGGINITVRYNQESSIKGNLYFLYKFEKTIEIH